MQNDSDVYTSCKDRSGKDIVELIHHSHGVHNVDLRSIRYTVNLRLGHTNKCTESAISGSECAVPLLQ